MDPTPRSQATTPQRRTPTRADVARLAGVSTGTVSHVVHGSASIRPETRRRVEEAMAELGYAPNPMASGLAAGRSGIVALMFRAGPRSIAGTDLEYVFAATQAAREEGFHVVVWSTDLDELDRPRQLAVTGLVEGVILMQVSLPDERIDLFQSAGVPVGLIGRSENQRIPYADADFSQIADEAVAHLHGLGHRRVGLISVPARETAWFGSPAMFGVAVAASCARLGLDLVTVPCDHAPQAGRQALTALLAQAPDTTGVICFNWEAAIGLLQEAHLQGIAVPTDLSVVLCANGDPEFTEPPLTTVSPPPTRIASAAVHAMIDHLRHRTKTPRQLLVPGELVLRGSTGPARAPRHHDAGPASPQDAGPQQTPTPEAG